MTSSLAPVSSRAQVPGILRHLYRLTNTFTYRGRTISYINIYARPIVEGRRRTFETIIAHESGMEGIACVDDVARAAILALQTYEQTGNPEALRIALEWMSFIEYMQGADGRFTNFILDGLGTKNLRGQTSRTGGTWWSARAMWALAMAWRVTGDARYLRRFKRGRLSPTPGMKIKALHALALMEIYTVQPDTATLTRICALCDAIVKSGRRYFRDHRGEKPVNMWGYHQLQAVARAGNLLSRGDYLDACASTVRHLIEPVIAGGFYHTYPLDQDCQCAYDVSPSALGLAELYAATGDMHLRELALRCGAWLDGANLAGVPVYDPRTGCCSDGITAGVASLNCGAESSIEAGFIELMRRRLRLSVKRVPPEPAPILSLPTVE